MSAGRSSSPDPTFDRIPRRGRAAEPLGEADAARGAASDHEGKRALFSGASQPPTTGSVAITCTRCGRRSVVSLLRLARLSVPGLHLPVVEDRRPAWKAWLTCPACRTRAWVGRGRPALAGRPRPCRCRAATARRRPPTRPARPPAVVRLVAGGSAPTSRSQPPRPPRRRRRRFAAVAGPRGRPDAVPVSAPESPVPDASPPAAAWSADEPPRVRLRCRSRRGASPGSVPVPGGAAAARCPRSDRGRTVVPGAAARGWSRRLRVPSRVGRWRPESRPVVAAGLGLPGLAEVLDLLGREAGAGPRGPGQHARSRPAGMPRPV